MRVRFLDKIAGDTKTVTLHGGEQRQFKFAVLGNPCVHPAALTTPYTDAFQHTPTTLAEQATDVNCAADGTLVGASLSDHGKIIIGLLAEAPSALASLPTPEEPTPGRAITVGDVTFQDAREFASFCAARAEKGYASGMGLIFRKVAEINPLVQAGRAVPRGEMSEARRPALPASASSTTATAAATEALPPPPRATASRRQTTSSASAR